ncbi:protein kinase [Streptomyces sp. NPDC005408]|uniref:protein kinase domain-containing protein n=1 Tax=Streptomyces sp. NPDC005408 TaxID=3155341 RepID=UPI0033B6004D
MHGGLENNSNLAGSGAQPLEPGHPRRIGSFRLIGVLGSGGMGRVYLGISSSGQYAAVKQVLPALAEDDDFLRHFGHELDNLARLPAGVSARMLASDRTARPPWFATGYIPGITLSEAVRLHGGALPGDSLWRVLRDAASGLRSVHAADIVHRDLKPSNVMLTREGLTLIDFGVARAADQSRLTRTGMVIGTPAFMAPEQAVTGQNLSGAADVFALGSLLLYSANGRPPFGDGSGPDMLYRIVHTKPDMGDLPETHPDLSAVITSCLAKDAADRPTAAELFELAGDHTLPLSSAASAPWPRAVAERIADRAAFAATVPANAEHDDADGADGSGPKSLKPGDPEPVAPEPEKKPQPDPPATPASPDSPKRRDRRTRVLLFVLPVVVVTGTTLTLALAPYGGSSQGAGPGGSTPSSVVSPSASPTGGGSPKPKAPSSRPPGSKPDPSSAPSSGASGAAGGNATTDGAGSAGSGSGASSGSSNSGGSGTSGGEKPPAQPAPSGTHLLKGTSTGRCLADSYSPYAGSAVSNSVCGEPSGNGTTMNYQWTYKPISGNTFRLVSQGSGRCIESRGYAGIAIADCNGSEAQAWQISATKSNGHTLQNVAQRNCLGMSSSIGFQQTSCNPSDPAQLWRNS